MKRDIGVLDFRLHSSSLLARSWRRPKLTRKGQAMEKKRNRNETKTPKAQPLRKIIGNSKLQIDEDDASRLIGSIVEKGMSDGPSSKPFAPTSAPKPTVLPFPVARHRSHGPVSFPSLPVPRFCW